MQTREHEMKSGCFIVKFRQLSSLLETQVKSINIAHLNPNFPFKAQKPRFQNKRTKTEK